MIEFGKFIILHYTLSCVVVLYVVVRLMKVK